VHSPSLLVALHNYLSTAYPVGAQAALGALRPLVGTDVAWIFQPYLALMVALGSVALYELLAGVVASRALRALCAFVAAQTGLVYAYYLQASIKELATTWLITLTVVLVVRTLQQQLSVRRLVPLAIVTVAAFDVLALAIVPWLGVPLGVFAAVAVWRTRHTVSPLPARRLALASGAFLLALGLFASPIIATARTSFDALSSVLTRHGDLGNLPGPLSKWELLGIWPSGDFTIPVREYRYQIPGGSSIAAGLIGLAVVSAILGTAWALRRRARAPLLLLAGSGLATIYLLSRASPYAGAKVMMICSVAIVTMVMLGAAALVDLGGRRAGSGRAATLPGWALAAIIAGGVLWTNVDGYGGARLAPRTAYDELGSIGDRFAAQGSLFYNLSDPFALHFLRPELLTDTVFNSPASLPGVPHPGGPLAGPWYPNELAEPYIQGFSLLVLGRSPLSSRPPADFRRVFEGHFFEVWRRAATPRVLEHLPLGGGLEPAAVPPCSAVAALAKRAMRARARLAFATGAPIVKFLPTQLYFAGKSGGLSRRAAREGLSAESALPLHGSGTLVGRVSIANPDRYEVWVTGSFSREIQVGIDRREVGSAAYEIGPPGHFVAVGALQLASGLHSLAIVLPDNSLAPGERARRQALGPVVLAPASGAAPLQEIEPSRARSLCGRRLDWIEIVRSA
jgi:hypothetical protein